MDTKKKDESNRSFAKIKEKYLLRFIHETQARGNTKYRIDDILTEFGDEILAQLERQLKGAIDGFRFE